MTSSLVIVQIVKKSVSNVFSNKGCCVRVDNWIYTYICIYVCSNIYPHIYVPIMIIIAVQIMFEYIFA